MNEVTLYHNPRCSKSREALALLNERGIQPNVVRYLETPPDATTLRTLLVKLGLDARAVLRTGEPEYRTLQLDNSALDDDAIIHAIVAHPSLLERPIAARGARAVVGRPPERVLDLL